MSYLHFDCRLQRASGFELDFQFAASGGVTGLAGPSGSGKTTTLQLIAGLLSADAGRIVLGDAVLFDHRQKIDLPPSERRIGLVFQEFALFPHKTVLGNLNYALKRRRGEGPDLAEVIGTFELGDLVDRYPRTLSGGQQQRAAVGRAILSAPRLLLLDEPFNAQHDELRRRIGQFILRVVERFGVPAILVSHDLAFLESLTGDIRQITDGRPADQNAEVGQTDRNALENRPSPGGAGQAKSG